MAGLIEELYFTLARLDVRAALDILVVAGVIYALLSLIRGTTGMALLRGVLVAMSFALIVSGIFQLSMLAWLLRVSAAALFVALVVLFQPELRRALERLGRTSFRRWWSSPQSFGVIDAVAQAAFQLAQQRCGALIVLERETGLQDYVESATPVDAVASAELLVSLFQPTSPLHDGAVIVRHDRVVAARCVLPLTRGRMPDPRLGLRHRAAIGVTEHNDAIAVVVSEETGAMSLATGGRLVHRLDERRLHGLLRRLLAEPASAVVAPELEAERV